ncbi:MAG: RAD55 family ATPase [Archaeoglobaceae archaeon]
MVNFKLLDLDIPKGNNLMTIGPPLMGKSVFARNLFEEKLKEGYRGIYVTTREIPDDVVEWFKDDIDFKILDCVTKTMSEDLPETEDIKRVSVMDLTGITSKLNKFLEDVWRDGNKKIVIVFDSLSTLLMYSNLQTVFRFLHILVARIKSADAVALYIIEQGMHDEATAATLKQLFSGAIEIKEEKERRFLRYIGSSTRTDWKEFEVKDAKLMLMSGKVRVL